MAQINFPAPSESPWTNVDSGVIYGYINGAWQAIGSSNESNSLPDGNAAGDYLRWDGTDWGPSNTIDGSEYAT